MSGQDLGEEKKEESLDEDVVFPFGEEHDPL